jgi:carbamoyltransferase
MQSQLNLKIKFRESFRPFAPIVLAEKAALYFDLAETSPYMLFTAPVSASRRRAFTVDPSAPMEERMRTVRSEIPAVTHLDFSARIQTVDRVSNPRLHQLLEAFDAITGCPVMINTSFNVRGEPPVCHPREAIECFLDTGIDILVLGNHVIEKAAVPQEVLKARKPRSFAPD